MARTDEPVEDRLARLRLETDAVVLRADFAQRVMSRVQAPAGSERIDDWSVHVLRWSRLGMAIATLAAAAVVLVAWDAVSAAEQEEAVGYGIVEAFQ